MSEDKAGLSQPDQQTGATARDVYPRLLDDLDTTGQQLRRVLLWQTLLWLGVFLIGFLAILALADWIWVLPRSVRMMVLVGALGFALAALLRIGPLNRSQAGRSRRRAAIPGAGTAGSDRGRIHPAWT